MALSDAVVILWVFAPACVAVPVLELDGAAGGGQLLRSAVALSALTGKPFRMTNIRGARPEPGLGPQHAAAVQAAAAVCDARVEGNQVGSEKLTFWPGEPEGGKYEVDVGTAGSVTLVCSTVLPLATRLGKPLVLTVKGGTDVKWAPPADYYRHVKLPLLARFGLDAHLEVERRGFYPAGGGAVTLRLRPSSLSTLDLQSRGEFEGVWVFSVAATDLEDADVAERQAAAAAERLAEAGLAVRNQEATYVETGCPGSALVVRAEYTRALAGFDALGERGKPSEAVAGDAVADALTFHLSKATVDEHAADQLLVFLALAGGEVITRRMTDHVVTSLDLLDTFRFDLEADEGGDGTVQIRSDAGTRSPYR